MTGFVDKKAIMSKIVWEPAPFTINLYHYRSNHERHNCQGKEQVFLRLRAYGMDFICRCL